MEAVNYSQHKEDIMNIYLAGGMKGDWQDKVMEKLPEHIFFDPRSHGLTDPKEYTAWDLDHVYKSDLIFACFTADNPLGFGMVLEIGNAYAHGIPIILVDEKNLKSWDMVRECCAYITDNLDYGINYIKELI